jgi:hypothetical protein
VPNSLRPPGVSMRPTGRYFMVSPRWRLHTCRGGGGGCGGRGRLRRPSVLLHRRITPPLMGNASVPSPHRPYSRPYGPDTCPPKYLSVKALVVSLWSSLLFLLSMIQFS